MSKIPMDLLEGAIKGCNFKYWYNDSRHLLTF